MEARTSVEAQPVRTEVEKVLYCINNLLFSAVRLLAGALFSLCIIINFANVIGRYGFHKPLYWAEEVTIFLIIWCVMLGAALVAAGGDHLKVEVLEISLKPKALRFHRLLVTAGTLAVCALVALAAYRLVVKLFAMGQTSVVAQVPMGAAFGALFVGFLLITLVTLCRLYERLLNRPGVLLRSWR